MVNLPPGYPTVHFQNTRQIILKCKSSRTLPYIKIFRWIALPTKWMSWLCISKNQVQRTDTDQVKIRVKWRKEEERAPGECPKYPKVFITAHHHNMKNAGTSWNKPSRSNQFMHVFFRHRSTALIFALSFFVLVIHSYFKLFVKLLSLILTSNSWWFMNILNKTVL